MRHRPVGLGVQGLADVFCRLKLPFESEAAKQLNRDIFEVGFVDLQHLQQHVCILFLHNRPGHLLRSCEPEHRSSSRGGPVCDLLHYSRYSLTHDSGTRHTKAALPAKGSCSLTCGVFSQGEKFHAVILCTEQVVTSGVACAGIGTVSSSNCR